MSNAESNNGGGTWPSLPYEEWRETLATLHMWTQVVGKVRLALAPHVNHWWQVPLYVTPRGLTTSPVPYRSSTFQVDFDFVDHRLRVATSLGDTVELKLEPRTVADFYEEFMSDLHVLGLDDVEIWTTPVEVENPIPFERDDTHRSYDAEYVERFRRALVQADQVLQQFRSGFTGKCSPVHFFWGSFDLAVTRFSGRRAPEHPGAPGVADSVTREAYSHEVSSAGFWPGGPALPEPIFYSYAYPEPTGFKDARVRPGGVYYNKDFKEFALPYEAARRAAGPYTDVLYFLQDTYEAAADLGNWDRAALER
ncbi:MAG: DUF5996 family protein [Acidobacteria bacterium]|nr:DUF5996 family protein [Acidobacteriota bacterium]